jgi:hypothetical protein
MKVRSVAVALSQLAYPCSMLLISLGVINPRLKLKYFITGSAVTFSTLIR